MNPLQIKARGGTSPIESRYHSQVSRFYSKEKHGSGHGVVVGFQGADLSDTNVNAAGSTPATAGA
jgi:hypothetical protein